LGKNKQELVEMMARETWLNADEAIEQGFADSKMFENDNMQIVASNTPIISTSSCLFLPALTAYASAII
jgi:ATP-dependent Clp protease protease subunit